MNQPCPYVAEIFALKKDVAATQSDIATLKPLFEKIDAKLDEVVLQQKTIEPERSRGYWAGVASVFTVFGAGVGSGAKSILPFLATIFR